MLDCMRRTRRLVAHGSGALVLLALMSACAGSTETAEDPGWSPVALSGEAGDLPEGRDVVRRVIDFMQSQDRLAFEVIATYEVVQDNGQKLQFDMLQRVALDRPRRLYWVTLHDDAGSETAWLADGTFTMVRQPANVWGQVTVPPTLMAGVSRIAEDYDVPVPFVDLLSGEASELWLGQDVEWVNYIGEAWVDGQWTDYVALRGPGADVQLWFRQGDEPFPVKMAIVHTDEDGLPKFSARFRQWSTQIPDGAIPPFVPPDGSEQLEIVPVTRTVAAGGSR
jgi:hypothetical protein